MKKSTYNKTFYMIGATSFTGFGMAVADSLAENVFPRLSMHILYEFLELSIWANIGVLFPIIILYCILIQIEKWLQRNKTKQDIAVKEKIIISVCTVALYIGVAFLMKYLKYYEFPYLSEYFIHDLLNVSLFFNISLFPMIIMFFARTSGIWTKETDTK